MATDQVTADAFATSWNNLPAGSVYTREQVLDWFAPLTPSDIEGRSVLELGCGNGSQLVHVAEWHPDRLVGVDLGASVDSARSNLGDRAEIVRGDLTTFDGDGFDVVYCIGVLHHLKKPLAGFLSVLRNTKPGGRFHCWVYAREGNGVIVWIVDPIRRVASRLPWWFTKHVLATTLVAPYFLYAKLLAALPRWSWLRKLPLYDYSIWIARRGFAFFRHVAFDQLVTPQTAYLRESELREWLDRDDVTDSYVICRNGNSWKFGGRKS